MSLGAKGPGKRRCNPPQGLGSSQEGRSSRSEGCPCLEGPARLGPPAPSTCSPEPRHCRGRPGLCARLGPHTGAGTTQGYGPSREQPAQGLPQGHLLNVPLRTRHSTSGPQGHVRGVALAAGLLMAMRLQRKTTITTWVGSSSAPPVVKWSKCVLWSAGLGAWTTPLLCTAAGATPAAPQLELPASPPPLWRG